VQEVMQFFIPKGVFFARGRVMVCDLKEVILDDILGDGHVSLTILNYARNVSIVMTIWKWPFTQTTMEGFLLKEPFFSYDENYVP